MPNWNDVQQFVRLGAQWFGGALVSKGYLDASGLEMLIGAIMSGGAFLWWLLWNRNVVKPNVG